MGGTAKYPNEFAYGATPYGAGGYSTMPVPSALQRPSEAPIAPQANAPAQGEMPSRPYEFVCRGHFDEEGALYYLGSFGKKRLYQNPHTVG